MRKYDITGKNIKKELESIFSTPQGTVEITNGDMSYIISQYDLSMPFESQKYGVSVNDEMVYKLASFEAMFRVIDKGDYKNSFIWNAIDAIYKYILAGERDEIELKYGEYDFDIISVPLEDSDERDLYFTLRKDGEDIKENHCPCETSETVIANAIESML